MVLKLDVKTLIIGIAIGVIVTAVIGADSADKTDFGLAVAGGAGTNEGAAIVRTADDALYVINIKSGMAARVLHSTQRDRPFEVRDYNGRPFFLSGSNQQETPAKRY